ncbi:hypothetical protein ACO2E2_06720 [Staphylococcus epidermidis]
MNNAVTRAKVAAIIGQAKILDHAMENLEEVSKIKSKSNSQVTILMKTLMFKKHTITPLIM